MCRNGTTVAGRFGDRASRRRLDSRTRLPHAHRSLQMEIPRCQSGVVALGAVLVKSLRSLERVVDWKDRRCRLAHDTFHLGTRIRAYGGHALGAEHWLRSRAAERSPSVQVDQKQRPFTEACTREICSRLTGCHLGRLCSEVRCPHRLRGGALDCERLSQSRASHCCFRHFQRREELRLALHSLFGYE